MPYITTTEQHGQKRNVMDMQRFAADLAKALGATVLPPPEYPTENAHLELRTDGQPSDLLILSFDRWHSRVAVAMRAPEIEHRDRDVYDKAQKTETATINPDGRKIEALAKDIKRRVIEPSLHALALQRDRAATLRGERNHIAATTAALKAELPDLRITVNKEGRGAQLYVNNENYRYCDAQLEYDGNVSINRIGTVSLPTFKKIVALLRKDADKSK